MKNTNPKAPPKRKAPRRQNTGRDSKQFLTLEKVIIHARPVNGGPRHISEILPAVIAELEGRAKR